MVYLHSMKQQKSTGQKKKVDVRYNKELNKYEDQILFPEKVAHARKLLQGVKLPVAPASPRKS